MYKYIFYLIGVLYEAGHIGDARYGRRAEGGGGIYLALLYNTSTQLALYIYHTSHLYIYIEIFSIQDASTIYIQHVRDIFSLAL